MGGIYGPGFALLSLMKIERKYTITITMMVQTRVANSFLAIISNFVYCKGKTNIEFEIIKFHLIKANFFVKMYL